MLPSQRALFDIPADVCYLNAASYSPLPLAVQEAGRTGVGRKGQPWTLDAGLASRLNERTRRAAAALINADPEDVALISSVAYGVATAGKLVQVTAGYRVLVLQDDHSSPVLEWMTRAQAEGFTVETVRQPYDGDWTASVLAAIARPGAPQLALASIASVHWSDGGALDLDRIAAALRAKGAGLLVDATHGVGVMKVDVQALDPDFLIFPTYKWVLGPYGRAFLYVARRHQGGTPLEQTGFGRRAISAESVPYMKDASYTAGARRFDMGERDHFISMEMAAVGMEMMAGWGQAEVEARLSMLTQRLADGLGNLKDVRLPDPRLRAPHILSLSFPSGMPDGLIERLAAEKIHVAPRLGRMRISPHVYNDEDDVDRFVSTFRRLVA
ncbi:aminotransferase class V-fold PLP-dependent enzyme [Reyranella sp. CPCC 100927]|uniref:aminotransferase class V-fold PLP-dependent enzyme n=1 Tax=Reyranella sp. CPCC 100927 TaxID=2599616 RepID=UPI0011B3B3A2|nr:aminotransferase class V-fold PLP-dependent enzyme [Reyranella sp. CPCC 100927]TWS94973.1 aminotransferase class V-fold PLP-dependent enzyme [Reyranella sp. CPCC 100927]